MFLVVFECVQEKIVFLAVSECVEAEKLCFFLFWGGKIVFRAVFECVEAKRLCFQLFLSVLRRKICVSSCFGEEKLRF